MHNFKRCVLFAHRRNANNTRNPHAEASPNIYGSSNDNAGVQPSAPSTRSSLFHDHTLIDNDLYQETAAKNSHPTGETPSNMVEMSPMEQHPTPPVYVNVMVQKNRPGNTVVQSELSAPASNAAAANTEHPSAAPSRSSTDHDVTLIDNDLCQ